MFLVVTFFFALHDEQPLARTSLYAVSPEAPWTRLLTPGVAYINVALLVQRARPPMNASSAVRLSVESGVVCPPLGAPAACSFGVQMDATQAVQGEHLFGLDREAQSVLHLTTNSSLPVALQVEITELSAVVEYQVVIAALVLLFVYVLIIFEVVHRTIAAMLGAFVVLAVLANVRQRPSFEEVLTWIDWETCGLLFGMMVMVRASPFPHVVAAHAPLQVGIFSTTGFFQFCAVRIYKASRGNLWRLVSLLCLFTATVSAFLDNVTTILLITPVTMQLCQVVDVDPLPIIVSLVLFSNVGGTATAIGDPPNILLVADPRIAQHPSSAVSFSSMTLHLMPGAILCGAVLMLMARYLFHRRVMRQPDASMMREIFIWRRTLARIHGVTDEEEHVRAQLQRHIAAMEAEHVALLRSGGDAIQVRHFFFFFLDRCIAHCWPWQRRWTLPLLKPSMSSATGLSL